MSHFVIHLVQMVGRQVKPIITIIPVNNNNTCNSNSIYNYDKNNRDDDDDENDSYSDSN